MEHGARDRATRERQDRLDRDERIRSAQARGEPHALIARREGVSARTVSRVLHNGERTAESPSPTLVEVDPFAVAAEVVESMQASLRELRRVAERTAQPAARVGALKAVPQVGIALIDLLSRLNLAPHVPVEWWAEREWQRARAALLKVAEERGIGADELQDALSRRIEHAFTPGAELGSSPTPSRRWPAA